MNLIANNISKAIKGALKAAEDKERSKPAKKIIKTIEVAPDTASKRKKKNLQQRSTNLVMRRSRKLLSSMKLKSI